MYENYVSLEGKINEDLGGTSEEMFEHLKKSIQVPAYERWKDTEKNYKDNVSEKMMEATKKKTTTLQKMTRKKNHPLKEQNMSMKSVSW